MTPPSDDSGQEAESSQTKLRPWRSRVKSYLDELEQIAETIDLILDHTRVQTVQVHEQDVNESMQQLQLSLVELEEKVAQRDQLLHADDAPAKGLTISGKLLATEDFDNMQLSQRCQKVAETIATAHERSVSLFVCQFHLADLTADIVKTLAGSTTPDTYRAGEQDTKTKGGGGLFDEAA